MNEHLKFSWGHIIAFLAVIILGYLTFVGTTYLTDGNFVVAGIVTASVLVVFLLIFIGAQMMKATDRKFARRIWIERILLGLSPIVFIGGLVPYFHFGTVQSQNDEIVEHFSNAIGASRQMFDDYEAYATQRSDNYSKMLDRVIAKETLQPDGFKQCGFTHGQSHLQKTNMEKTLRLQLRSVNYDSLRTTALQWIDEASQGASTWNVFLIGNTKEIRSAIHQWHEQLVGFSNKKLSNEEFKGYNTVEPFETSSASLVAVDAGLESLGQKFSQQAFPPIGSILGGIVLYLALLFPYFLQERHTKSRYLLWGMKEGTTAAPLQFELEENAKSPAPQSAETPQNDYSSFTL